MYVLQLKNATYVPCANSMSRQRTSITLAAPAAAVSPSGPHTAALSTHFVHVGILAAVGGGSHRGRGRMWGTPQRRYRVATCEGRRHRRGRHGCESPVSGGRGIIMVEDWIC